MRKQLILAPKHTIIEQTAAELACVWYEIGRSQGLTSKWSNPRSYARNNFTKFIPKAVEYLLSMLGRPDIHDMQKQVIYEAIIERHNDPDLCAIMPNIPQPLLPEKKQLPVIINSIDYRIKENENKISGNDTIN